MFTTFFVTGESDMRTTVIILLLAGLAGAATLTTYVFAQDREMTPRLAEKPVSDTQIDSTSGCAGCYQDILKRSEELGLTDKQQERIRRLESDSTGKRARMAFDMKKAEERLNSLVCGNKDDLPAIRAEIDKTAENWGDLRYACIRNMIEVRRTLGEETWNARLKTISCRPLAGFGMECVPGCIECTGLVDDDNDGACDRHADCPGDIQGSGCRNVKGNCSSSSGNW